MKKFILINTLLLTNVAPVSITKTVNELVVPIPDTFLTKQVINNKTCLMGLVDYGYVPDLTGYNALLLTKDYNVIQQLTTSGIDKRLEVVKSIDFEDESKLEEIASASLCGLTNLEKIIFPPGLKHIGRSAFINCPKLSILDFSLINKDYSFISPTIFDWSFPNQISSTGTIYVKNSEIKHEAEIKFHDIKLFKNWNVVVK